MRGQWSVLLKQTYRLLCLAFVTWSSQTCISACAVEGVDTLILCRSCGHEVASEAVINFVHSPLALSNRNDTSVGNKPIHVQLFQNPHGHRFDVITFGKADVTKHWPAEDVFSWFPGYSWTMATCPRCKAHLGWGFQPREWPHTVTESTFEESEQTFLALITDRLLREDYASGLLLTPKSFNS